MFDGEHVRFGTVISTKNTANFLFHQHGTRSEGRRKKIIVIMEEENHHTTKERRSKKSKKD